MEKKKFESTADVLEDLKFQEILKAKITSVVNSFENRPAPKAGMKWKRTWYDRFTDEHPFSYEFFMENIDKVLLKESKLRSEARQILGVIYNECIIKTIQFYHNQEKVA